MSSRALTLALALGALAAAPAVQAGEPDFPPTERLERARVCLRVGDLGCAGEELAAARARASELGGLGRVALERWTAEAALAAGDAEGAARALDALLALEPGYAPAAGELSAACASALAEARRRADQAPPSLAVHLPAARAEAGRPFAVEARVADPSGVARVVLRVAVADGTVVDVALGDAGEGRYRGAVPGPLVGVPELRLWVEAWDGLGNGPARWGGPEAPQRVVVRPREEAALTDRWWFWTAIGAGAVATGVVLAVLLAGEDGGPRPSEVGKLRVAPEFPR